MQQRSTTEVTMNSATGIRRSLQRWCSILVALILASCGTLSLALPAAAQIESPEIRQALADLESTDVDQRAAAAMTLAKYGPVAVIAAPRLMALLRDEAITSQGDRVSQFYSAALGSMGESVVPELIEKLDASNVLEAAGVYEALHVIGPDAAAAVEPILQRMKSQTGDRLWASCYVLEGVGPAAAESVPTLIPILKYDDFQLQVIACRALTAIGPESKVAVPVLLEILETGNASVKGHSLLALGAIGPVADHDIAALIGKYLDDEVYSVKERAVIALGSMGRAGESQLAEVDRYLALPGYNAAVPLWVTRWKISGQAQPSHDGLMKIGEAIEEELEAVHALAEMGPAGRPATSWLIPKLSSEDGDVVYETAQALAAFGDATPEVLAALDQAAANEDEFAADGVKEALARLKALAAAAEGVDQNER